MGIFGDKKTEVENKVMTQKEVDTIQTIERPRICCIDLAEETITASENNYYNDKIKIWKSKNLIQKNTEKIY